MIHPQISIFLLKPNLKYTQEPAFCDFFKKRGPVSLFIARPSGNVTGVDWTATDFYKVQPEDSEKSLLSHDLLVLSHDLLVLANDLLVLANEQIIGRSHHRGRLKARV